MDQYYGELESDIGDLQILSQLLLDVALESPAAIPGKVIILMGLVERAANELMEKYYSYYQEAAESGRAA